jgi:hypothetical protein
MSSEHLETMTMRDGQARPIRVVMFGSGPELTHDAREFLYRLEIHPEIELAAAFCQAESRSAGAVLADLWRRRRLLALPLFVLWVANRGLSYVENPRQEAQLRRALDQMAGRIHFVEKIHAPEVLEQVRALHPDLGLVYGSPILKPSLFEIPALGTFGIHHGRAPEYRGKKTTFWAMYNGEQTAGVTIQRLNRGLDTGDIIAQGEVPVRRESGAHRSPRAVVRELERLGLDLYIDAILSLKRGTISYRPQMGVKGMVYRDPRLVDIVELGRRLAARTVRDWERG